jgi:2,3-bisphosphoglycerate-independent phosphoglycerate mutase
VDVKPLVLLILDGFGVSDETEHNAIAHAHTPFWDRCWQDFPHTLLTGSGDAVGLPLGQMGNSEVGHLTMGAGRVVPQDFSRITKAIESGEIDKNPVLQKLGEQVRKKDKAVHLMGLLSSGGVHSHEAHFAAMIRFFKKAGISKIYLHAFLDGRDTPPRSAGDALSKIEAVCAENQGARLVSLSGRYYAMDRDQRWDRVEKTYRLLTEGESPYRFAHSTMALKAAYARGESDEFVLPSVIEHEGKTVTIDEDDAVVFMNFRADRARELTRAFVEKDFTGFRRKKSPRLTDFVTLTEYQSGLPVQVAFPSLRVKNSLGDVLANQGLRQLRLAETEKYAHVTFFFNGGEEALFPLEERLLIPSPKVATYDLQPEMSAKELTKALVNAIASKQFDVIIVNYANPDMVGHTGNFTAAIKAVETVDECLLAVHQALQQVEGEMLITADHGNVEKMYDEATGQAHTAHTLNPVPFLYVGPRRLKPSLKTGSLADIAPTLLSLLSLEIPREMTGNILFEET